MKRQKKLSSVEFMNKTKSDYYGTCRECNNGLVSNDDLIFVKDLDKFICKSCIKDLGLTIPSPIQNIVDTQNGFYDYKNTEDILVIEKRDRTKDIEEASYLRMLKRLAQNETNFIVPEFSEGKLYKVRCIGITTEHKILVFPYPEQHEKTESFFKFEDCVFLKKIIIT